MSGTAPWSIADADKWCRSIAWQMGFNYVPSSAVNTTEFWQAESFDVRTIGKELRLAADTGFNSCRVFIQELVWEHDPPGFRERFARFLNIAAENALSVMPVLFDDCAFSKKAPFLGRQDEPVPGRMMTSWTASPGHDRVRDRAAWPRLEGYVTDMVGAFAHDRRIVMWDLYNEPGNEGMGDGSLALVEAAFGWARAVRPEQPLTVGVWSQAESYSRLNATILRESDISSFHSYAGLADTQAIMDKLSAGGRPTVCTEWMARPLGSRVETHLAAFQQRGVGCYLWGFVNGRTQTHIPWEFVKQSGCTDEWFHDLFRGDGTPYRAEEMETLRRLSPLSRRPA